MKTIKLVGAVALVGGCALDASEPDEVTTSEQPQAATQTDVWQGTWNGGSASASFSSALGGGYLDVFENKSNMGSYAQVNFSTWSYDPTSQQCFSWTDWFGSTWDYCYYTRYTYAYGWGSIPNADAQLGPGTARLNTTLGAGFSGIQCTFDWTTWSGEPCTSLAGGVIDVRWNKDGVSSMFNSGTTQQTMGPYTFKTQGTYRSASARVGGNILGLEIANAYGSFGDTRGVSVSKSVFKSPKP